MLPQFISKNKIKNLSENNRYLKSNKKSPKKIKKKKKLTRYNSLNKLPSINQNSDIASKIKKSSFKKSVSYLYQSLFPDEKNSMDEFLNNIPYNKNLQKPKWKCALSLLKEEEKIKNDLMSRNIIMKDYNKMKKPSWIKKEFKKKPRMAQIIEDNILYKNRFYDNPTNDEFNLNNKKKEINLDFNNNVENEEDDEYEEDEEYENEDKNDNNFYYNNSIRNKNKVHFSDIYKKTIYPFINGQVLFSPMKSILIKEGDKKKYYRNILKRANGYQYDIESIEEESNYN